MTIGLTGGIGCGKSSVLPAFEKLGFAVIDTDKIASGIHSDPDFRRFARERFGENVFDSADGALRRDALAKIVFSDPAALADLEAFMHPRVRAEWKARVAASPARKIAVEVPLLFEKNYESDFDATVCVAASEDVQFSRLEKRGLPRERARERVAAQLPLSEKIRRADFVVFNDGSREFLEAQAREIDARLSA